MTITQDPKEVALNEATPKVDTLALIAVLLAVALGVLDTAIANTVLPTIANDLNASPANSIWVINAYQLAVVAMLLPLATLGDIWGPRKVFLSGLLIFTLASALCALSDTLPILNVCRALQGVGAAGIMSVNIALIKKLFPPDQLGRGVGMNALVVGVSFALGPTLASTVLLIGPWQWLFGMNVPLGLLALFIAWSHLPKSKHSGIAFDPVTAVLTSISFGCLIFGLSSAAQKSSSQQVLPYLAVAAVSMYVLLKRQKADPAPMLPVDLLKRPLFALSAVTSVASFATQGLAFVALPFYFEHTLNRSPVETGFLISAWPVVVSLLAPIAGRLSDRYPAGLLGGIGLSVLSLGMLSLSLMPNHPTSADIMIRMAICGAGFGGFQSPNLRALMSSAPAHRSAGASGVIAMARLIGQTSGAAVVALCLGFDASRGPLLALWLGCLFAAVAALTSFARLWSK